jgi:hypothetical protein
LLEHLSIDLAGHVERLPALLQVLIHPIGIPLTPDPSPTLGRGEPIVEAGGVAFQAHHDRLPVERFPFVECHDKLT